MVAGSGLKGPKGTYRASKAPQVRETLVFYGRTVGGFVLAIVIPVVVAIGLTSCLVDQPDDQPNDQRGLKPLAVIAPAPGTPSAI